MNDDHELDALGETLARAARGLLDAAGCRTAQELAERAKIDGTTARRVVRMVAPHARGAAVLTRSPSHAHLQKLANQARTRGVDPAACDALHAAAVEYAALLKRRGVSRAGLTRHIRDDAAGGTEGAGPDTDTQG
jgi:hypothetical protein